MFCSISLIHYGFKTSTNNPHITTCRGNMTSSHIIKYLQVTWNDNVSLIFVLMEMRYENKWKWNGTRKEKRNENLSEWYTSHEMFTDVCYLVDEPFSVYQITFLSYYMTYGCKNNWKNEAKPGYIALWKG